MDLIQRLPKAALVTFVALLFFGGSVGLVMAATSDQGIPDSMQVAAPKAGDQWTYVSEYEFTEGEEFGTGSDVMTYAWGDATVVYDEDGRPRHVQPLHDLDSNTSHYVDHDTRRVVAESFRYEDQETRTGRAGGINTPPGIPGVSLLATRTDVDVEGEWIYYGEYAGFCGFHSTMHVAEQDLSEPILINGDCRGFDEAVESTEFHVFESRVINGIPTVGFEAKDKHGSTKIWYNLGIPYPVAMDYELNDFVVDLGLPLGGGTQEFRISIDASVVLTQFVPGDQPWGVPAQQLPPRLTPVDTTAATALSVDDRGINHPFKLSEAFEGALNDLTYDDLRSFMAKHPDARAVSATNWVQEDGNYMEHRWDFTMWDDGAKLNVDASRFIAKEGTPEAIAQSITGPEESYGNGNEFAFLDFSVVNEARIPEHVPVLADSYARFEQATGMAPTSYGFDYTCMLFCWSDRVAALEVAYKYEESTDPDFVAGTDGAIQSLGHRMVFGDDGKLVTEFRDERQGVTRQQPLLGNSVDSSPNVQASDDNGGSKGAVWAIPPAPAAAGIGFVAFIVGAAYWLWPTIKTVGFMGLFSRIQSDQLLQHPVRSGIYEAVEANPGIHYQGLVREVGKGRGVVEHHLRKLQQGGFVTSQSNGGHTCFFPKGIADHAVLSAVPVLKTQGAANVLRQVAQGCQSITQVAVELDIAKSTASHHVRRLREAGLIEPDMPLRPAAAARKALTMAA